MWAMLLSLIVVLRGGLQRHNIQAKYKNRSTASKVEIEDTYTHTHTGYGDLLFLLRAEIRLTNILYKYFARETHKYILLLIISSFPRNDGLNETGSWSCIMVFEPSEVIAERSVIQLMVGFSYTVFLGNAAVKMIKIPPFRGTC
jgi:hypothetical protein